jgi:hypothetical protein
LIISKGLKVVKRLFILFLIMLLAGCFFGDKKVQVRHVAFSETIMLRAGKGNPYRIRIQGKGRVEGVARISLIENGVAYETEELNGNVDFVWDHDYYDGLAVLQYDHGSAKSGHLSLTYRFYY